MVHRLIALARANTPLFHDYTHIQMLSHLSQVSIVLLAMLTRNEKFSVVKGHNLAHEKSHRLNVDFTQSSLFDCDWYYCMSFPQERSGRSQIEVFLNK